MIQQGLAATVLGFDAGQGFLHLGLRHVQTAPRRFLAQQHARHHILPPHGAELGIALAATHAPQAFELRLDGMEFVFDGLRVEALAIDVSGHAESSGHRRGLQTNVAGRGGGVPPTAEGVSRRSRAW